MVSFGNTVCLTVWKFHELLTFFNTSKNILFKFDRRFSGTYSKFRHFKHYYFSVFLRMYPSCIKHTFQIILTETIGSTNGTQHWIQSCFIWCPDSAICVSAISSSDKRTVALTHLFTTRRRARTQYAIALTHNTPSQ